MADHPVEGARGPGLPRYSVVAIVLHWLIAAAVLAQFVLASRMDGRTPEAFALVQLHKSIGITILALTLARLAWRLTHRPPPEPPLATWERFLSRLVHTGFYLVMIAMPLTGWLMVSASRFNVPTWLYGVLPWPHMPGVATLAPGPKALAHQIGETGHHTLAVVALTLVALHVAGALKHQLLGPGEPVLSRMAPGARPGRWAEPRLFLIVTGALAAAALAAFVAPTGPRRAPPPPQSAQAPAPAPAPVVVAAATAAPLAEPVQPPPPKPAAAPEPTLWSPTAQSSLKFTTAWGGQPIEGRFSRWTAKILFSPEALDRSKVTVSIDLGSADTGDPQRDEALRGPDWFDVAGAPKATFTASRFEAKGPGRYVAHGVLELRGVKRPLDLPFRLKIADGTAEASGEASLDRSAFGVGQREFAGTDQVPAAVSVRFSLTARAKGTAP